MTTPSIPAGAQPLPPPNASPAPAMDSPFGALWPEHDVPARPWVVAGALVVGLAGATVLPERDLGLGTFLVLLAATAVVVAARPSGRPAYFWGSTALVVALLSTLVVRDAAWITVLCVLAAFGVGASALVDARTFRGLLASAFAVPLAALRGMPWLGRTFRAMGRVATVWPALRTTVLSVLLVLVFGALFASADAVFARWVDVLVPDVTVDTFFLRVFLLVVLAVVTLAASYVALNPPRVERLAVQTPKPLGRAFEWLVPVGLVLALYVGFVAAQLSVMFGGHDYLRSTTGLTYAEYVHQGFGQLTVTTALTLGVVAAAARKASRETVRDRMLLRSVLGALCLLTLVVVASALFRIHVYEEAYGFTELRLLVSVFEGWLGLLVVLVLVAGVALDGRWVPRAAVLTGAGALLALAAINPDGYVAARNVERYLETGKADWYYLAGLSADAVPALRELPADVQGCVLGEPVRDQDDWLEWNLGRARAEGHPLDASAGCAPR